MVTKWLDIVCINYSRWNFKEIMLARLRKTLMEEVSHFINICPKISIQVLDLHDIFPKFWWTRIKLFLLVLGSSPNGRKSSMDKVNTGNPKANRGCPPSTVNRTSAPNVCKTQEDPPISPHPVGAPSYCEVQPRGGGGGGGGYSSSSRAGRLGRTLWPQNSTSVAETEKGGQNSTMTPPPQR